MSLPCGHSCQVIVCSYFAHHLNVFRVASREHVHTLEDRASQLGLRTAALTHAGGHLVLSNYSRTQRTAYVSLWDLRTGTVSVRTVGGVFTPCPPFF